MNKNRHNNNCPLSPRSVNEWTELSPKTPLLVRNVEYNMSMKLDRERINDIL